MIDYRQALQDPSSVFESPVDVFNHPDLTKEQKKEILEHWEYDVREMEVAEEENMPSTNQSTSGLLTLIHDLLRKLNGGHGGGSDNKQG